MAVFPQICSYVQSFFTRAAVAFCSKVCTSEIKLSRHLPRCTWLGLSSFSNTADASEEPGVQAHSLETGPGPDDVLSAAEMVTASHILGNAFPLVSPRETGPCHSPSQFTGKNSRAAAGCSGPCCRFDQLPPDGEARLRGSVLRRRPGKPSMTLQAPHTEASLTWHARDKHTHTLTTPRD